MIYLIIGVPGAGKTYFAVNTIKNICEDKKDNKCKYKHVFTNINGLQYDKLNQIAKSQDFAQPFDFEDLKLHIVQEYNYHEQYKKNLIHCEDYDEFVKSQGVFQKYIGSCIFIDECHLYFESKATPELVRFLSYHRHFDIDLYLITQNKNLIDKKYLVFVEKMYKGLPSSKRFFSNVFRYEVYASYQEYKSNRIEIISLKAKKEIFDLYNSGSVQKGKSVLHKFLLPILLLSVLSYFVFDYFVQKDTVVNNDPVNQELPVKSDNEIKSPIKTDDKERSLFSISCIDYDCSFKDTNSYFSLDSILKLFEKFNCKEFLTDYGVPPKRTYIVECDSKMQNLIDLLITKQEFPNETDNNRPLLPNLNGKF
ncbi:MULTISPECIES: zonular occludens toxin domain-containing protein [unclassified Nitratiruptor]|uniref:zonular occludens toxin domain-containing protein n=1 Tax=unclassified Nitratiruptor TaxID=2624044 RepID=UPI0019166289|nr:MULTISPECIES: zonular occludens toxin domain-containing protein [unclassified Nitratiruptor]BCD60038.1 zona occludens toxin [Nitratiruptor sp. YY08-10]BCD63958.1 zona occludens toxin [Nitratiruptor sp. YY08-14]BCD64473.1 zona occludens toxin [Nitratiruptor sp. YY08-14]